MMVGPIQFRDKVLRNIAAQGVAGAFWLEALPDLLDRLEVEWSIKVGRLFPNATEAFVSDAVTADGQPVALKIPIAGLAKAYREQRLRHTAGGRGYVRVLRRDTNSGAMLLERLGPQLAVLGLPIEEQIRVICRTLQQAWMPIPPGARYPTGAEKLWKCHHTSQRLGRGSGDPARKRSSRLRYGSPKPDEMPSIRQIRFWRMATRTPGTRCSIPRRTNTSLSTPTACSSSARTI